MFSYFRFRPPALLGVHVSVVPPGVRSVSAMCETIVAAAKFASASSMKTVARRHHATIPRDWSATSGLVGAQLKAYVEV